MKTKLELPGYPQSQWKAEDVEEKEEKKSRWKQWPASLPSAARKPPGPITILVFDTTHCISLFCAGGYKTALERSIKIQE